MRINELKPTPIEKVHFNLALFKSVPHEKGCYILATFDNDILYIGLATDFNIRFIQHLDDPKKTKPTKDGKAFWFYYLTYNPKNLEKLERTWLNQFRNIHGQLPILNKISSPVS